MPKTNNMAVEIHTSTVDQPFVRHLPVLTYLTQASVPMARSTGNKQSNAGLAEKAPLKSNFKRLRHIRLTPQPGH